MDSWLKRRCFPKMVACCGGVLTLMRRGWQVAGESLRKKKCLGWIMAASVIKRGTDRCRALARHWCGPILANLRFPSRDVARLRLARSINFSPVLSFTVTPWCHNVFHDARTLHGDELTVSFSDNGKFSKSTRLFHGIIVYKTGLVIYCWEKLCFNVSMYLIDSYLYL